MININSLMFLYVLYLFYGDDQRRYFFIFHIFHCYKNMINKFIDIRKNTNRSKQKKILGKGDKNEDK